MVKNNYSSGRNDDRLHKPNGDNEPQAFRPIGAIDDAAADNTLESIADVMPCHPYSAVGNMNLNSMLVENIRSDDYFKGLAELKTFEDVVDQIYYDCKFVTPWVPGTHKSQKASGMCSGLRGVSNAGTPSTGYMLLFKLYTLQITTHQIRRMLNHTDSPYIRALGFLYLRHACDPKELWTWCKPFVADPEELYVEGADGPISTIGRWLRGLLTEQEYHGTMLPRLPVPVARDVLAKLQESREGSRLGDEVSRQGDEGSAPQRAVETSRVPGTALHGPGLPVDEGGWREGPPVTALDRGASGADRERRDERVREPERVWGKDDDSHSRHDRYRDERRDERYQERDHDRDRERRDERDRADRDGRYRKDDRWDERERRDERHHDYERRVERRDGHHDPYRHDERRDGRRDHSTGYPPHAISQAISQHDRWAPQHDQERCGERDRPPAPSNVAAAFSAVPGAFSATAPAMPFGTGYAPGTAPAMPFGTGYAPGTAPALPFGTGYAPGTAPTMPFGTGYADAASEAKPPSAKIYDDGAHDGVAASLSAPASSTSAVVSTSAGGGCSNSAAAGVAAAYAPPKTETAAEKLARLRAKQAARVGGAYLTGSVGGDYSSSSGALPPAKGLQRYQELVRKGN